MNEFEKGEREAFEKWVADKHPTKLLRQYGWLGWHARASFEPTAQPTGVAAADRIINRLMSSDPEFDDCADAAKLINRLIEENKGPDGFATWKDAALSERMRRVAAEQMLVYPAAQAEHAARSESIDEHSRTREEWNGKNHDAPR